MVPSSTLEGKINPKGLKFHQVVDGLVKEMDGEGEKDGLVNSWLNTGRQYEKQLAKYEQLIQAAPERVRSVFEGTVGVCGIDETLDGLEDIEEEDVYSVEGEDETNDADNEDADADGLEMSVGEQLGSWENLQGNDTGGQEELLENAGDKYEELIEDAYYDVKEEA